jgi:hypothetical protein
MCESGISTMKKKVLVSVIMPTYNCGKYISKSIDSVISQTISDWEIQIVDDCSTDNTYEVLMPYIKKYSNIHYYKLSENSGPAVARTEAIKRATGKYIASIQTYGATVFNFGPIVLSTNAEILSTIHSPNHTIKEGFSNGLDFLAKCPITTQKIHKIIVIITDA